MKPVDISGLTSVPETMLITVRARAIETDKPKGIVRDPYAKEILSRITAQDAPKETISPQTQLGVCIRTEYLDSVVRDFLSKHPDGTIVNIGCGLDARYERLNNGALRWFDLDLPEAIAVRRSFFENHCNYTMIAHSALDFRWMAVIPDDKPLLFLSEGVLMYFEPGDAERLLQALAQSFPGATVSFDLLSPWLVKNSARHPDVKKYDASFRWGVEESEELRAIHPAIGEVSAVNMMECYPRRWPLWMQLLTVIPRVRTASKLVQFRIAE